MGWHAAVCEAGRELVARDALSGLDLPTFCPHERVTRRQAHPGRRGQFRLVERAEAIYPGYCFVDALDVGLLLMRRVRGLLGFVSVAGRPLEVPGRVMARMRALAGEDGVCAVKDMTLPSLTFRGRPGQAVEFRAGSFAGFVGLISSVAKLDSDGVIAAWVHMLGADHELEFEVGEVGRLLPRERAAHIAVGLTATPVA